MPLTRRTILNHRMLSEQVPMKMVISKSVNEHTGKVSRISIDGIISYGEKSDVGNRKSFGYIENQFLMDEIIETFQLVR